MNISERSIYLAFDSLTVRRVYFFVLFFSPVCFCLFALLYHTIPLLFVVYFTAANTRE